ncbi:hypothetical protein [Mycobacterium sp. MFM001]|uniref:hypothetical protein n=1 Tax=Mycobacterium sp. MFM001 TaxID=2049453 RepID=UPI001158EC13|nr:hypothetical protein [Mycobacterium sp. MFM001]
MSAASYLMRRLMPSRITARVLHPGVLITVGYRRTRREFGCRSGWVEPLDDSIAMSEVIASNRHACRTDTKRRPPIMCLCREYGLHSGRGDGDCGGRVSVARLESDVLDDFTARLEDSDAVPAAVVDQLRTLLAGDKLPKPEVLVALYNAQSGDRLT